MSYKCIICGTNEVDNPGDVCELCAVGQDPYVSAMGVGPSDYSGATDNFDRYNQDYSHDNSFSVKNKRKILLGGGDSISNLDPYGNSMDSSANQSKVNVYKAGQVPSPSNFNSAIPSNSSSNNTSSTSRGFATSGITKNISTDIEKVTFFQKLTRTLFLGVPFALDNNVTMFQVFPDYTGTALNAQGNACDQVIIYGQVTAGAVAENNDVEIYGARDSNNNIVAKTIINKASGTRVTPSRVIPAIAIWGTIIAILAVIVFLVYSISGSGVSPIGFLRNMLTNLVAQIFAAAMAAGIAWALLRLLIGSKVRGKTSKFIFLGLFIAFFIMVFASQQS